ncbi:cutinase family protein [Nocardia sp. 2]|uniref:Cutinase family protein n=1 Tax=Nocardia acididurans TaxID=2802282 RepID=A0ABS1MHD7_9NOCA|nr:cutinase family protein [Nocardia acididurans]MBL1080082.1 cutinase family protein [Nocardia acididurans]
MTTKRIPSRATTIASAAVVSTSLLTATASLASAEPGGGCPAVYALGVQGTGQSSVDAAPTTDTGMLSEIFIPFQASADAAKVSVAREYIPYEASFGGMGPSTDTTAYQTSITDGLAALTSKAEQIISGCASTYLALAGYSQGAHAVSMLAQKIGAGSTAIPADRVAAVALFGDPTRGRSASVFPGTSDTTPDAVPGTSGTAVSVIDAVTTAAAPGSGIGPERDIATSYGALTGRVASFCSSGDLSCDAPDNAALLRTVANVAGQVEIGNDPIKAIASITQALALTGIKAATSIVNDNIQGTSLASLSLNSKKSISATLAEASDPRTELDIDDALKALLKVGTIAINAISTVVKTVFTPASITEIAAAGLANPVAGLAVFGSKLAAAIPELIPPATASKLIQSAFTEVVNNISDNQDLLNASTWTKYSDAIMRHGSYQSDPISGSGKSAVRWVADWFAAAAADISGVAAAFAPAPGTAATDSGATAQIPDDGTPTEASAPTSPAAVLPDFGATANSR